MELNLFNLRKKRQFKKWQKKLLPPKIIKKGTLIELKHLEFKSPGDGLPPYLVKEIIGKKLNRDVDYEHIFKLSDFI